MGKRLEGTLCQQKIDRCHCSLSLFLSPFPHPHPQPGEDTEGISLQIRKRVQNWTRLALRSQTSSLQKHKKINCCSYPNPVCGISHGRPRRLRQWLKLKADDTKCCQKSGAWIHREGINSTCTLENSSAVSYKVKL